MHQDKGSRDGSDCPRIVVFLISQILSKNLALIYVFSGVA